MDIVGPLNHIIHLMAKKVENMKSKKLKTMNLMKACKWSKKQSKKFKVLKTNIVTSALSLATKEVTELEQFMLNYARVEHDGNMLEILNPGDRDLKVVSYLS